MSAALILLIILVVFLYSLEAIFQVGIELFTLDWNPSRNQFGILPMLYGSAAVTSIAMLIAIPFGLLAAIFSAEMLPVRLRHPIKAFLELLAGIPSVIYGLLGIVFLGVWVADIFSLSSGRVILTGALLLAIMILPTLISLSDDALRNVPERYREAGKSLGLYPYQVIGKIVLPAAMADLTGAILLALGRALGETMAVMLVIGGIDRIPEPFVNILSPGQTITSKLGRELAEAAFGSLHFSALITMGLVLLLSVLLFSSISMHYFKPQQRLYE